MNRLVLRLLVDYCRRTFAMWPLLLLAQSMQLSAFWALHVDRLPLLGAVIGSLACFMAFESPYAVLRTLPLSAANVALFRWWGSTGWPGLFVVASSALCWLNNGHNAWARPSLADAALSAAASWAALAWLAVLPLPARERNPKGFGFVWGGLAVLGLYGVPSKLMPRQVLLAFIASGVALSVFAYVRASLGHLTQLSIPGGLTARRGAGHGSAAKTSGSLRGWSLIIADLARGVAFLSLGAAAGVSFARWLYPGEWMRRPLEWLFVFAVAVVACLQTRRWLQSAQSLRLLPLGAHRLAIILYAILIVPGISACLFATGLNALVPQLGVHVPFYLFVVLLATPATAIPWQPQRYAPGPAVNSIQQWAPMMQLTSLPMWGALLSVLDGPWLMSATFLGITITVAVGVIVSSYFPLLARIRSPAAFERHAGPLSAPS